MTLEKPHENGRSNKPTRSRTTKSGKRQNGNKYEMKKMNKTGEKKNTIRNIFSQKENEFREKLQREARAGKNISSFCHKSIFRISLKLDSHKPDVHNYPPIPTFLYILHCSTCLI